MPPGASKSGLHLLFNWELKSLPFCTPTKFDAMPIDSMKPLSKANPRTDEPRPCGPYLLYVMVSSAVCYVLCTVGGAAKRPPRDPSTATIIRLKSQLSDGRQGVVCHANRFENTTAADSKRKLTPAEIEDLRQGDSGRHSNSQDSGAGPTGRGQAGGLRSEAPSS